MNKDLQNLFSPSGLLAQKLAGYESRPHQTTMAASVGKALESGGKLVVEAGTGTGKTLAYLIPAILWSQKTRQRVVVSTATHALQDQLMNKDIPLVEEVLGVSARAFLLKGRNNYLCRRKLAAFQTEPLFHSREEALLFEEVLEWADSTERGERSELSRMPDDSPLWPKINSTTDDCLGPKCSLYRESFSTLLRAQALDSELLVVNHHLFFADLALREQASLGVLPDYGAVIFDEAHGLEDVATQFFGRSLSSSKLEHFCDELRRWSMKADYRRILVPMSEDLAVKSKRFFDGVRTGDFKGEANDVMQALTNIHRQFEELDEPTKEKVIDDPLPLKRRLQSMSSDLQFWVDRDLPHFAYWTENENRRTALKAAPIRVAEELKTQLLSKPCAMVFTSATLAVQGKLSYFSERIGLEEADQAQPGLCLPSEFDHAGCSLLYIPKDLPDPNHPEFLTSITWHLEQILTASKGRALLLFTSLRNMNEAYKALKPRLPYRVFLQGEAPKKIIMEEFRKDIHSVLFASHSFWEGFDVPGEALSCVVIDKLPFAPPDDPLTAARINALESEGKDPFRALQLPRATLSLKQGIGRLLRHREDRGVVAILDGRLWRKSYGKVIRGDLSSMPITADLTRVVDFFKEGQTT